MSITKFFDVHTHVQFHAFKDDADSVINRALEAGVWMINVGTQKDTSEAAIKFAEKYTEGVYATVGLHPIHTEASYHDAKELGDSEEARGFTSRGEIFDYEAYKKLALHPKVVAIGECGLDYYRLEENTKKKQYEVFTHQIELAKEIKKPLMIHCRNAFGDLIGILKVKIIGQNPGIIHFFSGNTDDAKNLLDLGFYFSFGGVITFARDYDEVIQYIPLDRIVTETDAPYVTPAPYRGKRNEPLYVFEVVKKISELKNISLETAGISLFNNALNLFKIKSHD